MAYSGKNYRSILNSEEISFNLNFHLNNITGVAVFGFSGDTSDTKFDFVSGRIYDPENRYVFSYTENEIVNLSGNLSGENYDYFINQTPVCFAGKRTNENISNFFINTTGSNFYADTFNIYTNKFNYRADFDTGFIASQTLTGKIESLDAGTNLRIFSGEVITPPGFSISGFDSGERQSASIAIIPSGILNPYNIISVETNFYTNFGQVYSSFDSTILPLSPYDTSISLIDIYSKHGLYSGHEHYVSDKVGDINTGDYIVLYRSHKRREEVTGEKEMKISLIYQRGNTGNYHRITGLSGLVQGSNYTRPIVVNISGSGSVSGKNVSVQPIFNDEISYFVTGVDIKNSGSNYQSIPNLTFNSKYGESGASGKSLMNFSIRNIQITNSGSGYLYPPGIVFTGGRGESASGNAFTGSFGIVTGTQITNKGSKYTGTFAIEFTGGNPTVAASGYATMTSGKVTGIKITNGGETGEGGGYLEKPTVVFSDGSPSVSASGNSVLGSGFISNLELIDEGVYFSGAPILTSISGGVGSGASVNLMTTTYEKTLIGEWDISTGVNRGIGFHSTGVGVTGLATSFDSMRGLVNYTRSGHMVGNHRYDNTGEMAMIRSGDSVAMRIFHFANYDRDIIVARLEVSGLGEKIITKFLTGVR